jgi:hypothetical protein
MLSMLPVTAFLYRGFLPAGLALRPPGIPGSTTASSTRRAKIHILVCDVSNLAILDHQPGFRILAPGVRLPLRVKLLLSVSPLKESRKRPTQKSTLRVGPAKLFSPR